MKNDNNIRDSYEDYDDYYEYEDAFNLIDEIYPDTLLSNMDNSERELIEEAIKISNLKDNIQIQDKAFVHGGKIDSNMFGIHIKNRRIDTTPFWHAYDKLRDKTKTITMENLLKKMI